MDYLITTYVIYAAASLVLTGVLARTLFHNGAVFLKGVFEDNEDMAEAVNHLLVVGFYMLNLGYAFVIFRTNQAAGAGEATENLVTKLGLLLLSLGVIHFVNVTVFWKMRRRSEDDVGVPPVRHTAMVPPPPPAPGTMVAAGAPVTP